jgi:tetratricopeptide (TPR) repeat protein
MSSSDFPSIPEAGYSFVGSKITLEGFLRFSGNMRIDGRFFGDIEGRGRLELGSKAHAEGKISADELVHRGHSEGDLLAVKRLELLPGCLHRGDIEAKRVKISPHASLQGSLKMPEASPDLPPDPLASRRRFKLGVGMIVLVLAGIASIKIALDPPPIWTENYGNMGRIFELGLDRFRQSTSVGSIPEIESSRQKELIDDALRLENEGKNFEAVEKYTEAIRIGGRQSQSARLRVAKIYSQMGRREDAISHLIGLLKETPGNMEARILLGDLYLSSGNLQKAAAAYADAARRDPADIILKRRLKDIQDRLGSNAPQGSVESSSPVAADYLRRAEQLLVDKKTIEAAKVLRKGIALMPKEARLHYLLGSALAEMGERTSAVKTYKKVIELAPDWLDAYVRLGALLEAGRRDKEAIALYRRAADLDPSNVEMLVRIPNLLKRRGRQEEAEYMLLNLQKKYPQSTEVLVELGNLYWEQGKSEQAKRIFQKVISLKPDSAPALNRLAWFHALEMKNLERGIELSKQSLEVSPDSPPYLDTLAELFFRNGQPVKAIPLIQRAIELEPGNRYYRVQLDKFKRASR